MAAGDGRARLLATLVRLDQTKVFLGTLVLAAAGLFLPGALGGAVLLAIVGGLAALLSVTWAVNTPFQRLLRVLVLVALAVVGFAKIL
jgi:hypothetical protein